MREAWEKTQMSAVDTEENERQRRCFLQRLYAATDGNYSAARAVDTIASEVGLGTQEGYRIAGHLVGCGRLRWRAAGVVSVTPAGAEDVEQEAKAERERRLTGLIRACDIRAIRAELERFCETVTADSDEAVTAACSVIERTFETYIAAENLTLPRDPSVRNLWRVVERHLSSVPTPLLDHDLKRVLRGLSAVVDGIAAFRTHTGDAHGRGPGEAVIEPRHARLVVHAAHTVVAFVLEAWHARRGSR
jgi:hypothetical protein